MRSLYDLKPKFQEALRPFADELARRAITPNQITVLALVVSVASGMIVALFPDAALPLILLALVLLLRMALNAIDGMIAREHDGASPGGRLLNEIADVGADMALYLPLVLVPEFSPVLVTLVVAMAVLTEVAGLAATSIGVERRHDGPMGKSDRAAAIGVLALLAGIGILPAVLINLALAVIVGAAFLTLVNRVNGALEAQARLAEERATPTPSPTTTRTPPPSPPL